MTARPRAPVRSLAEAAERTLRAADEPLRAAFLARLLNAVARLAGELDDRALSDAAGAPSDYAALLHALESPSALGLLEADDPLAVARLRGLDARAELLQAEGGVLRVSAVGTQLGISRQAVEKRRRAGRLLALPTARRGYLYPVWQFGPDGLLHGLEAVLADLRGHDPWTQAAFFLNENEYLSGESPLTELRRGNLEAVRRAAQSHGEHGAA